MITKEDIGRKVLVNGTTRDYDYYDFVNREGVIIAFDSESDLPVAVAFDKFDSAFHDCDGLCEEGRGFYVKEDMITFLDEKEDGHWNGITAEFYDRFFSDDQTPYESLESVLDDAFEQASETKGKERHANDNNFEDQVICVVGRLLKDHPFGAHAYQVIKKTIEAGRLYRIKGPEAAYQEVLGAINYSCAMGILIKEDNDEG